MVKSALLLRAIEDVKRIWRIRDDKAALASLHQRGLLGDDTKSRFEFAEKELEAEILDVVQEANSFKQGWGTLIFSTATEMAQAERTRETVLNIPKIRQREGGSFFLLLFPFFPSTLPFFFSFLLTHLPVIGFIPGPESTPRTSIPGQAHLAHPPCLTLTHLTMPKASHTKDQKNA
jgi:hypothetical protein